MAASCGEVMVRKKARNLVKDLTGDDYATAPENLTAVGSVLFFTANAEDDRGSELWRSDGTSEGTFLAADIAPGDHDSNPNSLTDVDGTLFFAASTSDAGEEPWMIGQGSAVSGIVFGDLDGDGVQDDGESVMEGVDVFLDADGDMTLDEGERLVFTDVDGIYRFVVDAGVYSIVAQPVAGFVQTLPAGGVSQSVTVESEEGDISGINFGFRPLVPDMANLVVESDTGESSTDNITRLNNESDDASLTFEITGVASGTIIRLFADDLEIGGALALDDTVQVTSTGRVALADGTHEIRTLALVNGLEGELSQPLVITVDTTLPPEFAVSPPVAIPFDSPLVFNVSNSDGSDDGILFTLTEGPDGAQMSETGVLTWTPREDQLGVHSFAIQKSDAAGNAISQQFDLTVLGTIPAFPDSYEIDEDQTLQIDVSNGVLGNDADEQLRPSLLVEVTVEPEHGDLDLATDGSFTYIPDPNFSGEDTFRYRATDGADISNEAPVTITVRPTNDPPNARNNVYTLNEDETFPIDADSGLLANDHDPDGDAMTATIMEEPSNGTVTLELDGSFTYIPNPNFFGDDLFTYLATDENGASSEAQVRLQVVSVEDTPQAIEDSYTATEDELLTVDMDQGVLANDTDGDGDSLTATVIVDPDHGRLSFNDDGSFTYTPDDNFFGSDSFQYRASDGNLVSETTEVSINVTGVDDPPTAVDDELSAVLQDGAQVLDVLDNDSSDPDDAQELTIVSLSESTTARGAQVRIINDGAAIEYTPGNAGFDSFTYTIEDSDGLTAEATVTVDVSDFVANSLSGRVYIDSDDNGVSDASENGIPGVMITLTGTDDQGSEVNQSVLTSDLGLYTFTDLRPGTYALEQHQPASMIDGLESVGSHGGTAVDDAIRQIVLESDDQATSYNFAERGLSSKYISIQFYLASTPSMLGLMRSTVAQAEEDSGNVELAASILDELSDVPSDIDDNGLVAANLSFDVDQDQSLSIDAEDGLLTGDLDGNFDDFRTLVVSDPQNGTLDIDPDGSFFYSPRPGFTGEDEFTYVITDGENESNEATVTISINESEEESPIELAPLSNVTLLAGSPLHIPLDGFHAEGDDLTYTVTTDNGAVDASVLEGNRSMRINVTGFGDMVFELFEGRAPRPTERIIELAEDDFFENIIFHRIIDGFVIQGGDPRGTGTGGSTLGDFDDQFHVDLQHNRGGVLSMAKSRDDTNDSQFFITEGPTRSLDFNHSIFGQLIEGEDVRELISNVDTDGSDRPLDDVSINFVDIFEDSENGLMVLSAPEGFSGETIVSVTVTDESDNSITRQFQVTVEPDTFDGGPFLDDIGALQTAVDTPITIPLMGIDVEGDDLEYDAIRRGSVNYDFEIDSDTGELVVTPPTGFRGTMEILVSVAPVERSNTGGGFDTDEQLLEITVL